MPTVQSTYGDNIAAGYVGAIANQEPRVLISRTVEDAAGIAFGLAVMQGTEDKGCVVSDGTEVLGITVREMDTEPSNPDIFAQYDNARIMTKGVIWVANSGGVAAGDPVVSLAAGALGTGTSPLVAGARWETTAADGELAQLRLG
jgi:hypothetical protein